MSKLDELICELCPDGVVFKRLDSVCKITRGRVMSKDYLRDNFGEFPVYSSQTANNGIFGFIDNFDYDFESITWTTDGANAGSVFSAQARVGLFSSLHRSARSRSGAVHRRPLPS